MKMALVIIVVLVIFNFISCKKVEDAPLPIIVNVTLATQYISHTSNELKFKVRFLILDSRTNGLTDLDISNSLYIDPYTGTSGANYTFSLDSFKKVTVPFSGKSSTVIMLDESEIEEDNFQNLGPTYVLNRETACRKFFKNISSGCDFVLSAYGSDNQFLPSQPISIYGENFTNNALIYDQTLADLRRYGNFGGNSPFLIATDSLLEFINSKASNSNKNLVVFSHSEDNVGGKDWQEIINKALEYKIRCNVVMTYQSTPNFYELIDLACKTGGFIFFVENNQDGKNIPFFADNLNGMLNGNIQCFETVWTKHSDQPIFESNYYDQGYLELYIDKERLYTYLPYSVGIP